MEVNVKIATILLDKARPPLTSTQFTLDVDTCADVEGLIRVLGLPPKLVGSVTVNNRRSRLNRTLSEGDKVAIIPSISGG